MINYFDNSLNILVIFQAQIPKISGSSFWNPTIGVSLPYIIINWIPLGFRLLVWQNKKTEGSKMGVWYSEVLQISSRLICENNS